MPLGLALYVHPWGHLNDLVVPAGAVACMNAIPGPKLGRYAFELDDDEIRAAAFVCVDLHWGIGLTGFERVVRHVRAVSPTVPIVVGGITAAHFAEQLLEEAPIDFVLRGDSEPGFVALARALREGERRVEAPNVLARGAVARAPERIDAATFDATDSLTIDWFPTYARLADVEAAAFPQARTIMAARGCPQRCPTCYGSHAASFGPGYLWRSPARTATLLREAERLGARNLRVIVGKPSERRLGELIDALAEGPPHRFGSAVGFYLCRAPTAGQLDRLERAFETPVTLSLIPPDEHVPAASAEELAGEQTAWREVAARAACSPTVRLDVWATTGADTAALRRGLGVAAAERHVSVSSGAVWAMSRAGDGKTATLAELREAVEPLWTFYAARLLSPALARLLAPFRFLDEVDDDLDHLPAPESDALAPFHARVQQAWRAHRLPTLAGLSFEVVPVSTPRAAPRRTAEGTRYHGDWSIAPYGSVRAVGEARALEARLDHRGVSLEAARIDRPAGCDTLAIIPRALDGARPASAELGALARRGVVVLHAPPAPHDSGASAGADAPRLKIDLRVQDARAFLFERTAAEPLRRGVASLGYFQVPRRRAS